jgi:hypothetical protein
MTGIGYFGASDDQTIRIRIFLKCEVAEAAEVN